VPSGRAVVLSDVVVRHRAGVSVVTALDRVTHRFSGGVVTLLSGPSGSGKTTALMVLAGMLRPQAGRVTVGDVDVYAMSDAARSSFRLQSIGFVFQQFHLFPSMTVVENVASALSLRGVPWTKAISRADDELAAVGMAERRHEHPASLSGGEQQRAAIARALVTRPAILAADEPTASLDWQSGAQVMSLLQRASRTRGTTVVVVSHDPRVADHCDECVEMRDGRFV
jgi:putative ABC transport system ATP-binding protein